MNTSILSTDKDPMGAAILDYQMWGKAGKLCVLSSMFEEDEMPVKHLFRDFKDMPKLEQKALTLAKGRVLDVGAGAGCHALALQKRAEGDDTALQKRAKSDDTASQGKAELNNERCITSVKAIDISPLSCEAMQLRGVKDVECINLFNEHFNEHFDTILLLMNGTGIAGKIANLPTLFQRLKALLNEGGQILIDSSDLKYIYENEDGSFDINLNAAYYGEVDYQMVYDGMKNASGKHKKSSPIKGEPFDWLYVDFPLLQSIAEGCGLRAELIAEGEHYDYLARIM